MKCQVTGPVDWRLHKLDGVGLEVAEVVAAVTMGSGHNWGGGRVGRV